jgi:hypothetical protein
MAGREPHLITPWSCFLSSCIVKTNWSISDMPTGFLHPDTLIFLLCCAGYIYFVYYCIDHYLEDNSVTNTRYSRFSEFHANYGVEMKSRVKHFVALSFYKYMFILRFETYAKNPGKQPVITLCLQQPYIRKLAKLNYWDTVQQARSLQ